MDVRVLFVLFGAVATSQQEGVVMHINKIYAYEGESGLEIRCESEGYVINTPKWMIISMQGLKYLRPIVYLSKPNNTENDTFEWGEQFNTTDLLNRVSVTGQLAGISFLQLNFHEIKCGDGGRYTCTFGGYDGNGDFKEFSRSGNFIVKTIDGPPTVKDQNGTIVNSYTSIAVKPGDNIVFTCEGYVGKPRIPILWLSNDLSTSQKRLLREEDGFELVLQMIPDNDLCRFMSQVKINFTMPHTKMLTLTCNIAFRDVIIILHPPVGMQIST